MNDTDNFSLILQKLENLENKMNNLENKINMINAKIDKCENSCNTMDEHINFVQDTYQTLRTPLDYIRIKVNYLIGNENESIPLPQIKNKSNNLMEN